MIQLITITIRIPTIKLSGLKVQGQENTVMLINTKDIDRNKYEKRKGRR